MLQIAVHPLQELSQVKATAAISLCYYPLPRIMISRIWLIRTNYKSINMIWWIMMMMLSIAQIHLRMIHLLILSKLSHRTSGLGHPLMVSLIVSVCPKINDLTLIKRQRIFGIRLMTSIRLFYQDI
jgi:hypothetical protein